jgi:hypothetical protein
MISTEIIERLQLWGWSIDCDTAQKADLVLEACNDAGLNDVSGAQASNLKRFCRDLQYPICIGYREFSIGVTISVKETYEELGLNNITDWFFNTIKNNDDNGKLTPQNAEQEHWVQIILARIRGIPIESFSTLDGTWVDDRNNSLIFMNCEYRIKPEPASTPLPISRELWSYIDKRWRFIAIDRSGAMYLYLEKPTARDGLWLPVGGVYSHCPLNINTDGIYWETSLTERPEDV